MATIFMDLIWVDTLHVLFLATYTNIVAFGIWFGLVQLLHDVAHW